MEALIEVKDFSFSYQDTNRFALRNVSLEIERGEIVLIAGPSGCGKSTLLRSLNGLIPHMYSGTMSGSVVVEGLKVSETPIRELAKRVGFVFQNPENQIFMFSVRSDVAFGLENLGLPRSEIEERVEWAMELLGINHLADRALYALSDGQKQRVALAGVLAMKPSIIVLDEPTSVLDPHTALALVKAVKQLRDELDITVLFVEHRLELVAPIATRLVVMDDGRVIVDGSPRFALSESEVRIVGVGVPASAMLHIALERQGLELGELSLQPSELAAKLNPRFN